MKALQSPWLKWLFLRVITPIGWFASMIWTVRPSVSHHWQEFGIGAGILLVYAIAIDWPGKLSQKTGNGTGKA